MTTMHTAPARRSARGALVALFTGAGLVLTPLAAQASAPDTAAVAAAPAAAPTAAAQVAVDTALAQLGDPYVWAAAGPNAFDCSGLTQYAYKAAGISLPHSSISQSTMGKAVAKADLKPGDLVFFYTPVSHVGMYIGNGQIVHAPTTGSVVKIVNLSAMSGYNTARRLA
jgi:cell wall-associated NlpC family hydrolase